MSRRTVVARYVAPLGGRIEVRVIFGDEEILVRREPASARAQRSHDIPLADLLAGSWRARQGPALLETLLTGDAGDDSWRDTRGQVGSRC